MSTDKLPSVKKYKKAYSAWRLAYLAALGLSAAGVLFALVFIYQNIYATAENSNAIEEMRTNISWFSLDLRGYEEITSLLAQKNALKSIVLPEKNIFTYSSSSDYGSSAQKK